MNKGSKVICLQKGIRGLTHQREYTIIAGQGDGVPRCDGKLGAFIQNKSQFVIEDDFGAPRLMAFTFEKWGLSYLSPTANRMKPEAASPIVHGHHVSMNVLVQNAVVAQGELSNGDHFGHG